MWIAYRLGYIALVGWLGCVIYCIAHVDAWNNCLRCWSCWVDFVPCIFRISGLEKKAKNEKNYY